MHTKKYSVASAISICLRYAPIASSIKLLIEAISGVLVLLMVFVVASFIDNATDFVSKGGSIISYP